MKITREVITDLLPLYLAGEASEDSRRLVDEYFASDPEFARLAKTPLNVPAADRGFDAAARRQAETLAKTKGAIRFRSWIMCFAIFFSLVPFSATFENGKLVELMWRDAPLKALMFQLVGIGLWALYYRANRRLRSTSL